MITRGRARGSSRSSLVLQRADANQASLPIDYAGVTIRAHEIRDEIGSEDASEVRVPRRRPSGAYRVNERLPVARTERREQGLGDRTVVQHAGDLVLVAQLAGLAHPSNEHGVSVCRLRWHLAIGDTPIRRTDERAQE